MQAEARLYICLVFFYCFIFLHIEKQARRHDIHVSFFRCNFTTTAPCYLNSSMMVLFLIPSLTILTWRPFSSRSGLEAQMQIMSHCCCINVGNLLSFHGFPIDQQLNRRWRSGQILGHICTKLVLKRIKICPGRV